MFITVERFQSLRDPDMLLSFLSGVTGKRSPTDALVLFIARYALSDGAEMRWISIALHRELGLKPWHDDVFDLDIDTPAPERLQTQFDIDQFCYVRDLRRQLATITQIAADVTNFGLPLIK